MLSEKQLQELELLLEISHVVILGQITTVNPLFLLSYSSFSDPDVRLPSPDDLAIYKILVLNEIFCMFNYDVNKTISEKGIC